MKKIAKNLKYLKYGKKNYVDGASPHVVQTESLIMTSQKKDGALKLEVVVEKNGQLIWNW